MASAHLLPQLVSASLLNATMDQPGWREARKIASRVYFAGTSALTDPGDSEALQMLTLQNRENVIRCLNTMITALVDLRDDIDEVNEKSLHDRLRKAQAGRQNWLTERYAADWTELNRESVEKVSLKERLFGTMFNRADKKDK